jgi:hypothetical protein
MRRSLLLGLVMLPCALRAQTVDWAKVDAAFGRTGAAQDGGVHRWAMPRSDLQVTASGVLLKPAFALGSWLAMLPVEHGVLAMGDLVLRDDELTAVLTALQDGGVEQSAIHHHVIRESPRVLYMHIHAHGDPVAIATTVRTALARSGTPAPTPAPAAAPAPVALDTVAITAALGAGGKSNGGVWQVSVPRAEALTDGGMTLPASMGVATAINFQPTGGGKAAITGDFVMTAAEVNPVIRALRKAGIEVTSLHNHLLQDDPRLFFAHFWAVDDAATLAKGLRTALDLTNVKRSGR